MVVAHAVSVLDLLLRFDWSRWLGSGWGLFQRAKRSINLQYFWYILIG